MTSTHQIVISASRRTDIPAFYMDWFMAEIDKGAFEVVNPYNLRTRRVDAGPDRVHTIVFWSKNFLPFITGSCGQELRKMGYHLFFNFTINSTNRDLEPFVPELRARLDQLTYLCRHFGPQSITWRFDPICFYRQKNGPKKNNLSDFNRIAEFAANLGVKRCITSFMDIYPKVRRRLTSKIGFSLVEPTMSEKISLLSKMQDTLRGLKIDLAICCENEIMENLPVTQQLTKSSCIPNTLLMDLYGGRLSCKPDTGQRIAQGCGCSVAVDIGSYNFHPCYHNCLFCYGNPVHPPE